MFPRNRESLNKELRVLGLDLLFSCGILGLTSTSLIPSQLKRHLEKHHSKLVNQDVDCSKKKSKH